MQIERYPRISGKIGAEHIFSKEYVCDSALQKFDLVKTWLCGNKLETERDCGTQDFILTAIKNLPTMDQVDTASLVCAKRWDPEGDSDLPEG